jgi:cold shock CspA family protein
LATTTGVVKTMTKERGFAFIQNYNGESIFLHRSALVEGSWDALNIGDSLSFEQIDTPKGWRAENAKLQPATSEAPAS